MEFKSFLLEIGTEEIPVSYIKPALKQLEELVTTGLNENDIPWDKATTFATPTRLVLYIERVAVKRPAREETIIGPPVKVAFNNSNKPTKASYGFAKKFGVDIKEIKVCDIEKGKYVCIKKKVPSKSSIKVFSEVLPQRIERIYFPKRMKWDSSGLTFARPIRWVCCLFNKEKVKFKVGGVDSDRYTYVTPSDRSSKIRLSNVTQYFKKLEEAKVILDHRRRKEIIKQQIKKIASSYNASSIDFQKELLEEVNFLVQSPTIFVGEFNKSYLKLPREVLLASMSKYQRVFGMQDSDKKLIPKFIGVVDGTPKNLGIVSKNYRMVLESRLQDSLFFFQQDTKTKLENKVSKLNHVIYHTKLGTMYDKVIRIKKLCRYIADEVSLKEDELKFLEKAVLLSKADLTTNMVNEFPSLQGVMGRIYALFDKEKKQVANAIYEHYLPRFGGDELPHSKLGTVISIADRIDSLIGYFGIDLIPSGSYDPYGLRRDTYAIIRTVIHQKLSLKFDPLIQKSIKLFSGKFDKSESAIKKQVIDFISDKLETLLVKEFKSPQLAKAVLEVGCNDIFRTYNKVNILTQIQSDNYFLKAAKVSERTKKIYKNVNNIPDKVNVKCFKHPFERKLWEVYNDNRVKISKLIKNDNFKEATRIYGENFFNIVHQFFDQVMVNVEDDVLRKNRLALCKKIHDLYNLKVAELSLLENVEVG